METIHYEPISPSPAEHDLMLTNQQPTLTFPFYEQQEFYPQLPTINYANIKFEPLESLSHPSIFTQDKSSFSAAPGTTFSLDSFADSKKVLPITDSQHPLKKKRTRTAYTKSQMNELEQEFQCNKYLPRHRRIKLSQILGIDESKIKIWFQNRRTRAKKEALEQQIATDSKIPASPPAKTKIEQASLTVLPPTPSPTTASDCSELDEVLDFITEATNHAREVRTVQNIKFDLELSAEAWLHSYKYHPYYN